MEHAAAQGWPVLKHNESLTGEVRHDLERVRDTRLHNSKDSDAAIFWCNSDTADVISCSFDKPGNIIHQNVIQYSLTESQGQGQKILQYLYQSQLAFINTPKCYFLEFFFQEKAVGPLESEKFKYYAFVERSDSPLYILLMCQSFVSLTWKGYLPSQAWRNLYLSSWMVRFWNS